MLEFYLRGKNKKPSVSFTGIGNFGVPMTAYKNKEQSKAFKEFSDAAHKFCEQMENAGEFDDFYEFYGQEIKDA